MASRPNEEDELQLLVQSLSSSEKRYVKVFAARHKKEEEAQVIPLFEQLCKKAQSDEELLAALKGIISRAQLPNAKNYLHRLILKSMRLFHEESSVRKQLRDRIDNAEFLFARRLYKQTMRELEKAKAAAQEYELWTVLLDIYRFEQDVLLERHSRNVERELDAINEETAQIRRQLESESQSGYLRRKALLLFRNRDVLQRQELEQAFLPLLAEVDAMEPQVTTFKTRHNLLATRATHAFTMKAYTAAADYYGRLLEWWEQHPHRMKEESIVYKKMLSNYTVACHALNDMSVMPQLLSRLRNAPCRSAEEEAEVFQNIYFIELLYLMNTDEFERLDTVVNEIEDGLQRYRTKINKARELLFFHNIAVAYFTNGNFNASLNWLTRIIQIEKTDHRQDAQAFARLFRLVLYYQLGKLDLLEYELINVERYLRQRKAWSAYEAGVVKFIKRILAADEDQKTELFQGFCTQLDQAKAADQQTEIPGLEELLLWARHHAGGRSIRTILREEHEAMAKQRAASV